MCYYHGDNNFYIREMIIFILGIKYCLNTTEKRDILPSKILEIVI